MNDFVVNGKLYGGWWLSWPFVDGLRNQDSSSIGTMSSEHGSDNCSNSDSDSDSDSKPVEAQVDDSPLQRCMDRNKQCKSGTGVVGIFSSSIMVGA